MSDVVHDVGQATGVNSLIKGAGQFMFGKPPEPTSFPEPGMMAEAAGVGAGVPGQISQFGASIPGLESLTMPGIQTAISQAMPGTPQSQNLFDMLSRQYMNEITPKLSGAGILTSGPGMNIVSQGMGDLATKFAQMQEGQLNQALGTGLDFSKIFGALNAMPADMSTRLISALMNQPSINTPGQPGFLQQIGGGQGMAGMTGAMGALGLI